MIRLKMKKYNNVNEEAVEISASSSGKADKYEYLTGEEIWSSDQKRNRTS